MVLTSELLLALDGAVPALRPFTPGAVMLQVSEDFATSLQT
jgi:hypothetical protein